jgi:hypothetical protein
MSISTRTSGIGTMVAGGVMLMMALLFVALEVEPFSIALILATAGPVLFIAGAIVCDQR